MRGYIYSPLVFIPVLLFIISSFGIQNSGSQLIEAFYTAEFIFIL
jgi:hypothetical protein